MSTCRIISFPQWVARTAAAAGVMLAIAACTAPARQAPEGAVLSPARVAEIVASPDRSDADRVNDVRRKPQEMLLFIGVRPGMTALDVSAAGGYTTELIARAVGPAGRVYGQSAPRPAMNRPAQPEGAAAPPMPMGTAARPTT